MGVENFSVTHGIRKKKHQATTSSAGLASVRRRRSHCGSKMRPDGFHHLSFGKWMQRLISVMPLYSEIR